MIRSILKTAHAVGACDICVVGAGAIGLCLLENLIASGLRVVCIVGGGEVADEKWERFNGCEIAGLPHEGIRTARPRVAGGATTLWGGQALPFQKLDFADRPWVSMPGWPIQFEEVALHYQEARKYLGLPGEIATGVVEDIKTRIASEISPDLEILVSEWTAAPNLFRVKRQNLDAAANLEILTDCHAVRVIPRGGNRRQNYVLVRSADGASLEIPSEVVILAAGTVENARLLLETQRAEQSIHLSPVVGRCFQDHVTCNFARLFPKHPSKIWRSFGKRYLGRGRLMPKWHLPARVQEDNRILNAACHIIPDGGNLVEVSRLISERKWGRLLLLAPSLFRYAVNRTIFHQEYWWARTFMIELHVEQEPQLESMVSLGGGTIGGEYQKPVLNWEVSDLTLKTIRIAGQYFVDALEASDMGGCEMLLDPVLTNDGIRKVARDVYHMIGTTRMGHNAATAVADVNCEVFGLPAVFVAGASVFPTGSFSNPTLTALALAIRLCKHLTANAPHRRTSSREGLG